MAWIPYLQPVGHRGVVVEDADDPVHPEAPAVALAEVPVEREEVPRDCLRDTARQDEEAIRRPRHRCRVPIERGPRTGRSVERRRSFDR